MALADEDELLVREDVLLLWIEVVEELDTTDDDEDEVADVCLEDVLGGGGGFDVVEW